MTLCLDEFCLNDTVSLQYVSDNVLKGLFDPQSSVNLRARGRNARLTPDVARVMTTNASSPAEWCGTRVRWSQPLARKCIVFVLTQPVVPVNWSSMADFRRGEP